MGLRVLVPQRLADRIRPVSESDGGPSDPVSDPGQRQIADAPAWSFSRSAFCWRSPWWRPVRSRRPPSCSLFTDWPSLRILWLLTQCTVVSVVLLVGSLLIFRKRAGIVVLHAGVGLMMFGELLVGISAVEGQMQIVEGQTVNYVMDTRKIELAIVDSSDQREDDVVVIPQSLLRPGTVVQDPQLPFDVEVVEFQINSMRRMASPADQNLATAGTGLKEVAVPVDPVSGTDMSGEGNRSAAYVRLLKKGSDEALGVYLVGLEDWFAVRRRRCRWTARRMT